MNNKAILLATIAFLAASSFLMIGGIGIQTAEAGGIGIQTAEAGGANCPSKDGAATAIDPNAPNAVNTNIPPITPQPTA
jgi:hypothetical protein